LQATLYRTPAGEGRAAYFSHPGDEFVLVIRGSIRYWVGSAPFELNTGDSLWHRSAEPHGWENAGQVDAVTLHVNTPPVWQRKQVRDENNKSQIHQKKTADSTDTRG
jgi:quercetin dioxygenase-like cupin family protein